MREFFKLDGEGAVTVAQTLFHSKIFGILLDSRTRDEVTRRFEGVLDDAHKQPLGYLSEN